MGTNEKSPLKWAHEITRIASREIHGRVSHEQSSQHITIVWQRGEGRAGLRSPLIDYCVQVRLALQWLLPASLNRSSCEEEGEHRLMPAQPKTQTTTITEPRTIFNILVFDVMSDCCRPWGVAEEKYTLVTVTYDLCFGLCHVCFNLQLTWVGRDPSLAFQ